MDDYQNSLMQDFQMIENLSELKCKNQHQDSQVILVQLDLGLIGEQRLLCCECLRDSNEKLNVMSVNEIIKKIKIQKNEKYSEKSNFIKNLIVKIESFEKQIFEYQETFLKIIQKILENSQEWKLQLNKQTSGQEYFFSFLEEINRFQQYMETTPQQIDIDTISQINKSFQAKNEKHLMDLSINISMDNLYHMNSTLKSNDDQIVKIKKDFIKKLVQITQIEFQKKLNFSSVDAFEINFDDSLIFIGSYSGVIAYNFSNLKSVPYLLDQYENHPKISMIIPSKRFNMFICYAEYKKRHILECYYQKSQEWNHFSLKSELHKIHLSQISLSNNDSELITCSVGGQILISSLDAKNNEFHFLQLLPTPTQNIFSITINNQHSQLLVQEQEIFVIWGKNKFNQWQLQQKVQKNTNSIFKIQIQINENEYLLQENQQFSIFTIKENRLIQIKKINVSFLDFNTCLKIQYNKKLEIFLVSSNKQLNFLKLNEFQEFEVSESLIFCESSDINGRISNQSGGLIFFDGNKTLKIFDIQLNNNS